MARKKQRETERKVRTREHIVADLSVNRVERLALQCGFSVQRVVPDYGYDLLVSLYRDNGEVLNETIRAQLKGSDNLAQYTVVREKAFSFPVAIKDYRYWSSSLFPVLLILYDASIDEAYWVDVRELAAQDSRSLKGKTTNVHVPQHHVLGTQTFLLLREQVQELADNYHQHLQTEK